MDKLQKELEEQFEPIENPKNLQQLLVENPQQKGGLKQLVLAERDGRLFSTEGPTKN